MLRYRKMFTHKHIKTTYRAHLVRNGEHLQDRLTSLNRHLLLTQLEFQIGLEGSPEFNSHPPHQLGSKLVTV